MGRKRQKKEKSFLILFPLPVRPEPVEGCEFTRTIGNGKYKPKKMIQNLLFLLVFFLTVARFPSTSSGRTGKGN